MTNISAFEKRFLNKRETAAGVNTASETNIKSAFTLIELLVVIAMITILPVQNF